jgi:predicted CoA-binding protein
MNKPTLVIGASENEERYSNMAVKLLLAYHHQVFAISNKKGDIDNVEIQTGKPHFEGVNTVTLYLNKTLQKEYYEYIISLHPERIIFNPGTENEELIALAEHNGINAIVACTLVLLKTRQY